MFPEMLGCFEHHKYLDRWLCFNHCSDFKVAVTKQVFCNKSSTLFFKNIHICPWYIFLLQTKGRPFVMAICNHNWMNLLLLMQRPNIIVVGSNRKMIAVIFSKNDITTPFLWKKKHKWKYLKYVWQCTKYLKKHHKLKLKCSSIK